MSTKGSVCFGGSWHLYTECFDEDPAQLHLDVGMVSRPSDPDDPPLPPTTPNVTIDAMVHVVFPREAVQRIAEFYQRQVGWEEKLRKESAGSSFAPSNEVGKHEPPSAPLIPSADEAADERIEALVAAQPKRGAAAPLIPQSRADAMVAEEREACAVAIETASIPIAIHYWNGTRQELLKAFAEKLATAIRARKTEAA